MTINLIIFKAFITKLGPGENHERRMAYGGSYKIRKYAEVNDNPLYRLPEINGGHRLDGQTSWQARAHMFQHH